VQVRVGDHCRATSFDVGKSEETVPASFRQSTCGDIGTGLGGILLRLSEQIPITRTVEAHPRLWNTIAELG
jgi:16S rRNA A1518/A1519 N6-dimethyltransferase RsmA/KsgA/DIM1 with predicted DNA glycosylase/AP lyase activity